MLSSIGCCAFLTGPPLIAFLGDHSTVVHALGTVTAMFVLATVIAPAVRPLRSAGAAQPLEELRVVSRP